MTDEEVDAREFVLRLVLQSEFEERRAEALAAWRADPEQATVGFTVSVTLPDLKETP